jgi:hypothetical protein
MSNDDPRINALKNSGPCWIRMTWWQEEIDHFAGRLHLCAEQCSEADYLYRRLDIVDNKVRSLMMFNTILLSVITFAIVEKVKHELPWLDLLAWGPAYLRWPALLWTVSTGCCLVDSFVRWAHLDQNAGNYADYAATIIKVTLRRTAIYQIAWGSIIVASILVLLPVVSLVFH